MYTTAKNVVVLLFMFHAGAKALLDSLPRSWQMELENLRSELMTEIDTCKKQIGSLNSTVNQRLAGGPVAFNAFLSKSISNMVLHQTIIFEDVLTNHGNGYDKTDGHFQAPVSGMYIFFVTLTSLKGHSASAHLMKDGRLINNVLAHSTASNEYETATVATVVTMTAGERVWVQNEEQYSVPESLDGGHWSSFSGHLIH